VTFLKGFHASFGSFSISPLRDAVMCVFRPKVATDYD